VQDFKSVEIKYEARMLMARACLLVGAPASEALAHLRELSSIETKYHRTCIEEVRRMIELAARPTQSGGSAREEGEAFQKMRREEDDNSTVMEGMPRFLVARKWFEAWQRYTGL
jgi:hypothetical protein